MIGMIGINEMIEYLFVIYMHDMQHSLKVKHYFFLLKSNICLQIK